MTAPNLFIAPDVDTIDDPPEAPPARPQSPGLERIRDQSEHHRRLVRALTAAVNTHRLACIGAGLEPETHDVDLWAALDELRLPDNRHGPGPTLAEMVLNTRWYTPKTEGGDQR